MLLTLSSLAIPYGTARLERVNDMIVQSIDTQFSYTVCLHRNSQFLSCGQGLNNENKGILFININL